MAYRVTYTDKSGKPANATFGVRAVAETYARSVRGATIAETPDTLPPVVAVKVADGTQDDQRAASKRFYYLGKAMEAGTVEIPLSMEQRAEQQVERYGEARLNGASESDALDYANGY